ncbi:MAG: phosphoribosyl-ATP diphosphatase [Spirochaetales bacterium]|nr:phosphoribosyl-ATP diphosphatase [Spirochaetales bacterium]
MNNSPENNEDDLFAEKPLVILDMNGNVLDLLRQNRKGHQKSIEQGLLWCMHSDSGKVLPWNNEAAIETVRERENWYEAVIARPVTPACNSRTVTVSGKTAGGTLEDIDILERLVQLLKNRKQDLPEGSYTTHLFSSGIDKIRKKTGEEAIELVLARENDEIIHEAADLLYHTMVLFAALDIPYNLVFTELKRRHTT